MLHAAEAETQTYDLNLQCRLIALPHSVGVYPVRYAKVYDIQ